VGEKDSGCVGGAERNGTAGEREATQRLANYCVGGRGFVEGAGGMGVGISTASNHLREWEKKEEKADGGYYNVRCDKIKKLRPVREVKEKRRSRTCGEGV